MNCWAMRTSRDSEKHRRFLLDQLREGLLRQGWGWCRSQDLHRLQDLWHKREELTEDQREAERHWRMGNWRKGVGQEKEEDYMKIDDLVVVPNMPDDGLFTICRIVGPYRFERSEDHKDFGHIRPVEVLTPNGVANDHRLVQADLRRSFRCRLRLWNIKPHCAALDSILQSELAPEQLAIGSTSLERVESIVSELITEPLNLMVDRLGSALPKSVRAEEWEPVLRSALESLFPVSVLHTGGPRESGADIEIRIPNPFKENRDWVVPVQVKDYEGEVPEVVTNQLETAFNSRSESGQVIAVVLLVSNAVASEALDRRMQELSSRHRVPFVFCGRDVFMQLLARGFLRRS